MSTKVMHVYVINYYGLLKKERKILKTNILFTAGQPPGQLLMLEPGHFSFVVAREDAIETNELVKNKINWHEIALLQYLYKCSCITGQRVGQFLVVALFIIHVVANLLLATTLVR